MRRLFLYAAFAACIVVCGCGVCGNEVVSETKSPDEKLKVVVYEMNCGPSAGSSTQISILSSGEFLPSGHGNLLGADDNNHAVPLGSKGTIDIKVNWDSNSSLSISYPKNAQVFLKKPHVAGVAVNYVPLP
jgi:hypothetical protein